MTGNEVLDLIQAKVEGSDVGIDLWLSSEEWARVKAKGVSFSDWVRECAERW